MGTITRTLQVGLAEALAVAGLPVDACYQCRKCTNGCPLTFAMDLLPDRVIRLALLGQAEEALASQTIWVCSSCETCTTRCPNGIDIAGVMDWLKETAVARGLRVPQPDVRDFHAAFLKTIKLGGGRLSEPLLLGLYSVNYRRFLEKLRTGAAAGDLTMALALVKRGRLKFRPPHRLRGAGEVAAILRRW
jgi:heterodisulfide reductase subunit C